MRCRSVDWEDLRGLKPSSFATWMMWRRVSGGRHALAIEDIGHRGEETPAARATAAADTGATGPSAAMVVACSGMLTLLRVGSVAVTSVTVLRAFNVKQTLSDSGWGAWFRRPAPTGMPFLIVVWRGSGVVWRGGLRAGCDRFPAWPRWTCPSLASASGHIRIMSTRGAKDGHAGGWCWAGEHAHARHRDGHVASACPSAGSAPHPRGPVALDSSFAVGKHGAKGPNPKLSGLDSTLTIVSSGRSSLWTPIHHQEPGGSFGSRHERLDGRKPATGTGASAQGPHGPARGGRVALLRATGTDPDAVSVQASSAIKALPSTRAVPCSRPSCPERR